MTFMLVNLVGRLHNRVVLPYTQMSVDLFSVSSVKSHCFLIQTLPAFFLDEVRLSYDFSTPHQRVQSFFLVIPHLSISVCCFLSYICL